MFASVTQTARTEAKVIITPGCSGARQGHMTTSRADRQGWYKGNHAPDFTQCRILSHHVRQMLWIDVSKAQRSTSEDHHVAVICIITHTLLLVLILYHKPLLNKRLINTSHTLFPCYKAQMAKISLGGFVVPSNKKPRRLKSLLWDSTKLHWNQLVQHCQAHCWLLPANTQSCLQLSPTPEQQPGTTGHNWLLRVSSIPHLFLRYRREAAAGQRQTTMRNTP